MPETSAADLPARVAQALARGRISWLGPTAAQTRAVWHAWEEPFLLVAGGEGEQTLPVMTGDLVVLVRDKDSRALLAQVPAVADRVLPGQDRWETAVAALAAVRQGSPVGATALSAHWTDRVEVWQLRLDLTAARPAVPDGLQGTGPDPG